MRYVPSLRSLVQSCTRGSRRGRQPARRVQANCFRPRMETLEDLTLPSTVFWTNPVSGSWHVPGNWSTSSVPAPGDDVIINIPGITVTHSQGASNVRSLTSQATFALTGGTLRVTAASVLQNAFTFTGGTFGGAGDLTVHGMLRWAGGMMDGVGQTTANGGVEFFAAFNNGLDRRVFNNAGTALWSGRGMLEMRNGAVFNNRPGATLTVQNLATFRLGWEDQVASTFNNQGTFRVNYAGDMTSFIQNAYRLAPVVNNSGTVHVAAGNLSLAGGGVNSGVINIAAGWRVHQIAGNTMLNAGTQIQGDGQFRVVGATVSVNTNVTARSVELADGMIAGTGTLTVTSGLSWMGGHFYGYGRTVVNAGAMLDISGSATKYLTQRQLVNGGTANWTGAGSIVFRPDGLLDNSVGAVFNLRTDAAMAQESTGATFFNRGTLRKILSSGTTRIDTYFENRGTMDVQTGTVRVMHGNSTGNFVASGTLEFAPATGSSHILQPGSAVTGGGQVVFSSAADVRGTYNVAGHTHVDAGQVVFHSGGTMGSLTINAGVLNLSGNLTINGLFTWSGGEIRTVGLVTANGGIAIGGAGAKTFREGTLTNAGLATWTGTGDVRFEDGGVFWNRLGATLDARSDAVLSFSGGLSAFTNYGTFRKSAGDGLTLVAGVMQNYGSMVVTTGMMGVYGASEHTGSVMIADGTWLVLYSENFFGPTSSVTGAGHLWVNGSTSFQGTVNTTGDTYVVAGVTVGGSLRTRWLLNMGVVYVEPAGSVTTTSDYTQIPEAVTYLGGGTMTTQGLMDLQGGQLVGWGTINANVQNAGRLTVGDINSAGLLAINGDYTQTAAGVLDIEIAGTAPGTQYDRLQVSGRATLDGTLNVAVLNGFTSNAGDVFRVLTYGSRAGQFGRINGLDLGGGWSFSPTYGANGLDLTTIRS